MITIIVAISKNHAIGKDNQLLWHLPNDLKRFKQLTLNHPIIMGRKTYESIGKPLPKRKNIVISSKDFKDENNLIFVKTLEDAIKTAYLFDDNIFIIGGGEIYNQSLNIADKLEMTLVDTIIDGDTFFPEVDKTIWQKKYSETHMKDDNHLYNYEFINYDKIN